MRPHVMLGLLRERRAGILVVALACICIVAALVLLRNLLDTPKLAERPVVTRTHYPDAIAHARAVNEVATVPASETAAFDAALAEAVDRGVRLVEDAIASFDPNAPIDARRPDRPATPRALESLRRILVEHVQAVTAENGAPFLALAEKEPSRWIGPGNPAWHQIDSITQHNWQRPGRRDDVRGELSSMLDRFWFGPEGNRFVGMASDEDGLMIPSGTTRVAADITRPLLYEVLDAERYEWFRFPGQQAIITREPTVVPADIIRRDGSVQYAHTVVVLRAADGSTGQWHGVWFYDPLRDTWIKQHSGLRAVWRDMAWFY